MKQTESFQIKQTFYRKYGKRMLDFNLSLVALVFLSPLLLLIALLVYIELGSPILHTPKRPGLYENIFVFYKFRSMTNNKDQCGDLLPDIQRLAKFGRMLRKTSLDELPELFNILKGDMSFVGPRPLALQYLPYYTPEERKRHSIRPGLTGLAQVNGRNNLTWEQKFAYDLVYIDSFSLCLDFKVIVKTIARVFQASNVGIRGVDGPGDFDLHRIKSIE